MLKDTRKLIGNDVCLDKGKYMLKKFKDIPVEFVLKLYFCNQKGTIYDYAKDNLDELLDKAKTTYIAPIEENNIPSVDCIKIKYINKTLANMEMKRIQSQIVGDYKPIRSYYCDNCNMWHLTSKSSIELEKYENKKENEI